MKNSKLDLLISDKGWKGIITRLMGVALVYFGLAYLPEIIKFSSTNFGTANASASQLIKHEGIMYAARIITAVMIIFEIINTFRIILKKRNSTYDRIL